VGGARPGGLVLGREFCELMRCTVYEFGWVVTWGGSVAFEQVDGWSIYGRLSEVFG